jgi:hypothetical protein
MTVVDSVSKIPVEIGTKLICIRPHKDGFFTVDATYKVNAYQVVGSYAGVRIRDNKRERKDFNFILGSRNYFWNYFKLAE